MFFFGQLRAGSSATRVDLPLQYLLPKNVSFQSDFSFRVIVTGAHARVLFFSSLLFSSLLFSFFFFASSGGALPMAHILSLAQKFILPSTFAKTVFVVPSTVTSSGAS